MKQPTFVSALASVLFALLLTASTSVYGTIVVQTTTASSLPLSYCTTAKITTSMTYNGDGLGGSTIGSAVIGPNEFYQTFPPGTTISIDPLQPSIANHFVSVFESLPSWDGWRSVKYTINLANYVINTPVSVDIGVAVSCDSFFIDLYIAYFAGYVPDTPGGPLVNHPQNTALTDPNGFSPDVIFPATMATMHIMNFIDDAGYVGAGSLYQYYPPTQKLLVSTNWHTRQYDFYVSDGRVDSLVFNYTPASNIKPVDFLVQGMHNNTAAGSPILVTYNSGFVANNSGTFTYNIDSAMIGALFGSVGYEMVSLDSIRVIETNQVIACSPSTVVPDRSRYTITWNGCPQTLCILPGPDGILDNPPLGDDVVSGPVITSATLDGILHTSPAPGSDDVISGLVITAGANHKLDTTLTLYSYSREDW